MGAKGSKGSGRGAKDEDDLTFEDSDQGLSNLMRLHLSRLIAYADSADVSLQREVAEKLANEAVKPERQLQIVSLGGLKLLLPLTKSTDAEVQRLAAHALANLSVNSTNQIEMAHGDGVAMLVDLLGSSSVHVQRQASK
ncbi:hypothetical protein M885DRAFT_569947 [Pelagophyceae sp. CCMP2097]|nr:hypothetical protein M885DRAFT_569947 [Pelagophyceae sp. CCMP2097]